MAFDASSYRPEREPHIPRRRGRKNSPLLVVGRIAFWLVGVPVAGGALGYGAVAALEKMQEGMDRQNMAHALNRTFECLESAPHFPDSRCD